MIQIIMAKCLIVLQINGVSQPMYVEGKVQSHDTINWTVDFETSLSEMFSKKVLTDNTPYVRVINNNNCLVTEWRKDETSN